MFNNKNKKATIGATTTWVVATIIILMVIIIFVYASLSLSSTESFAKLLKSLGQSSKEEDMFFSIDSEQMLLALLQTEKPEDFKHILGTVPSLIFASDFYVGYKIDEAAWVLELDNNIIRGDDKSGRVIYEETKKSFVYDSKNKKIKLFLDCIPEICG